MPSGAVTLLEQAKTMTDPTQRAIVGTYAAEYHPTTVMPMLTAPSGTFQWYMENSLPYTTGGVRNFNGSWTAAHGQNAPKSETIRIYGGQVQIDNIMAKINPAGTADQKAKQIKAAARRFTIDFFEGADGSALRGVDDWLANDPHFSGQTVNCGTSTTGATLTTDKLDEACDKINYVPGKTFMYCTPTIGLRIRKMARGTSYSTDAINAPYNLVFTPEQFGYFSGSYNGIPIVVLKDGKGSALTSVTKATSADSSNLYLVTYGEDNLVGFQVNGMEIKQKGNETVYDYYDFEWPVGVAPQSIRCIARCAYIKESVTT